MIKLKLVIIENKIARLNKFIDWLLYMVGVGGYDDGCRNGE